MGCPASHFDLTRRTAKVRHRCRRICLSMALRRPRMHETGAGREGGEAALWQPLAGAGLGRAGTAAQIGCRRMRAGRPSIWPLPSQKPRRSTPCPSPSTRARRWPMRERSAHRSARACLARLVPMARSAGEAHHAAISALWTASGTLAGQETRPGRPYAPLGRASPGPGAA